MERARGRDRQIESGKSERERQTNRKWKEKRRYILNFSEDIKGSSLPDSNGFITQFQGIEAKMFLTRCKDVTKKNSLYFTSMLVRDIVTSNVERVKIINTGVKAFCKCENKGADCNFRYIVNRSRTLHDGAFLMVCKVKRFSVVMVMVIKCLSHSLHMFNNTS